MPAATYFCDKCGKTIDVPAMLLGEELRCYGCDLPLYASDPAASKRAIREYRATVGGRKHQLAGFVLALLGVLTYGTTSPFGLLLSYEKLRRTNRDGFIRACDWIGIVLGALGTLFLPLFLVSMWKYQLMGPVPVLLYLAGLVFWTWHRVRIVWKW